MPSLRNLRSESDLDTRLPWLSLASLATEVEHQCHCSCEPKPGSRSQRERLGCGMCLGRPEGAGRLRIYDTPGTARQRAQGLLPHVGSPREQLFRARPRAICRGPLRSIAGRGQDGPRPAKRTEATEPPPPRSSRVMAGADARRARELPKRNGLCCRGCGPQHLRRSA